MEKTDKGKWREGSERRREKEGGKEVEEEGEKGNGGGVMKVKGKKWMKKR